MNHVLLAAAAVCAAAAIPMAPAQAQSSASAAFVGVSSGHDGAGVHVHRGNDGHGDHNRRDRRFNDDGASGIWVNGGEWALYNNRSWEPDSYNDWWHDRPDRAFPRWVQNNQGCERQWWSGGSWRC